jgi:flagellar protein FlaH
MGKPEEGLNLLACVHGDTTLDDDVGQEDGFSPTLTRQVQRLASMSSGIAEIDESMGGGIPAHSLTMIDGGPDSGKSVLGQQLVWGALRNGFRTTVFTTEDNVQSLVRRMESLNLDILDALLLDELRIYPLKLMPARENLRRALGTLLCRIQQQKDRDLILIDSLSPFLSHIPVDEAISFLEQVKLECGKGRSVILTIHRYACDEEVLVGMQAMCNAHMKVKTAEIGDKLVKSLEVLKVRGASMTMGNVIGFEVQPKTGIRIIPPGAVVRGNAGRLATEELRHETEGDV